MEGESENDDNVLTETVNKRSGYLFRWWGMLRFGRQRLEIKSFRANWIEERVGPPDRKVYVVNNNVNKLTG